MLIITLFITFFASCFTTVLILRCKHFHAKFSSDNDLSGPQKFHTGTVPRIGGISILIGISAATLIGLLYHSASIFEITLLLCSFPVFAIGLTEDLTKTLSVRIRLLFTAVAAGLAVYYLEVYIQRVDVPGIDNLLSIPLISVSFTVFAITGLSNAFNIIDGFNGLSSMVGIITLLGLTYVGFVVNDSLISNLSLIMVSSIMGFFVYNYPKGRIFLGDGGAYLIGFWIALLSILLVSRHSEISPWFAFLINAYPILETIFSIYRRKIHQGKNPGQPDGIHFHTLIYRRIVNSTCTINKKNWYSANAKTAPYLWVLSSFTIMLAIIFRSSTPMMILLSIIFSCFYVWIYKSIVNFKTPVWMKIYK